MFKLQYLLKKLQKNEIYFKSDKNMYPHVFFRVAYRNIVLFMLTKSK